MGVNFTSDSTFPCAPRCTQQGKNGGEKLIIKMLKTSHERKRRSQRPRQTDKSHRREEGEKEKGILWTDTASGREMKRWRGKGGG